MSKRHAFLLILALVLAAPPRDAGAFYQKSTVEGTIGSDLGGVWLSVQNVMPSFRVRLDRDEKNIAPFKVGPLPTSAVPAMGEKGAGVAITEFTDPGASSKYGLLAGDIVTHVNTVTIASVEDFTKALNEVSTWFLITVNRPALGFTSARLVKIRYEGTEQEVDGVTGLQEKIEVRVLEGELPFKNQLEEARRQSKFYEPTKAEIDALKEKWFELSSPAQPVYLSGEHRVVAASSYDASLRQDKNLDNTTFAIVSTLSGNPMGGGAGKNIAIYGFEKASADSASGNYVESTLASAPFPISIEFHGRFNLIKLAPYSDKDVEFQTAKAAEAGKAEQEATLKDKKLAPDVPADIPPAPKDQPAVAE